VHLATSGGVERGIHWQNARS